jgi:DNA-binding MarR family transcriptional regulator
MVVLALWPGNSENCGFVVLKMILERHLPDKLARLMFDFGSRVRRYRSKLMSQVEAMDGLSERDIAILELVAGRKEITFAEVAQELNLSDVPPASASTVSQAISALFIDRKLVEKRINPEDQRQSIISLTKKGQALVDEIAMARQKLVELLKDSMELSDADAAVLERAFIRGIENFDKLLV